MSWLTCPAKTIRRVNRSRRRNRAASRELTLAALGISSQLIMRFKAGTSTNMSDVIAHIRQAIRDIPDFPKPGIVFKDITPLLANGPLFAKTIDLFAERYQSQKVDTVLGIESRGFIIGAALAYKLGAGFSVVRKPGKLPFETHSASYQLEYGVDTLEIHIDAISRDARV